MADRIEPVVQQLLADVLGLDLAVTAEPAP